MYQTAKGKAQRTDTLATRRNLLLIENDRINDVADNVLVGYGDNFISYLPPNTIGRVVFIGSLTYINIFCRLILRRVCLL
jgi:hypothetical protein